MCKQRGVKECGGGVQCGRVVCKQRGVKESVEEGYSVGEWCVNKEV